MDLADVEVEGRTHLANLLPGKRFHRLDVPLSQRVHDGWLRQYKLFDLRMIDLVDVVTASVLGQKSLVPRRSASHRAGVS